MVQLKEFQKRAIFDLTSLINERLQHPAEQALVLQAPTGSGKTLIAASVMNNLLQDHDNLCLLWFSVGNAELHLQSREKMRQYFDFPTEILDENYLSTHKSFNDHDVLFVNFEKIVKAGNVIVRDSETRNLRDIISRTKALDRKIIAFVDEAHLGAQKLNSKSAAFLTEILKPDVQVEISATPLKRADVLITKPTVAAEHLIKSGTVVNFGLTTQNLGDDSSSVKLLLKSAHNLRQQLKRAYAEEGFDVNPLVLIQIENAKFGDYRLQEISDILAEFGVNTENQKLKIWLSNHPANNFTDADKQAIQDLSHPTEFLIFKTAIATGWDCPRASILVKFRESKSETLNLQTIGRIYRVINGRAYTNELLNKAYIFTNLTLSNQLLSQEPTLFNKEATSIYGDITLDLPYDVRQINTGATITVEMMERIDFHQLKLTHLAGKLDERLIYDYEIATAGKLRPTEMTDLTVSTSLNDVFNKYKTQLQEMIKTLNVLDPFNLIESYLMETLNDDLGVLSAQIAVIQNAPAIINFLKQKLQQQAPTLFKTEKQLYFPARKYFNTAHQTFNLAKSLYQPFAFSAANHNNLEEAFVFYLNKLPNVKWFVNNDKFSIKYGENKLFYPDFIVAYDDGSIGIYDTKSGTDYLFADTALKQAALFHYIENYHGGLKVVGGMVKGVVDQNSKEYIGFKLFAQENYALDDTLWRDF